MITSIQRPRGQDLFDVCAAYEPDCALHSERVGAMSGRIARALRLTSAAVDEIARAAPLHDVGKLCVPRHILTKAGPLTDSERRIVQQHTTTGAALLRSRGASKLVRDVALYHHERWDGTGYPFGLAGDAIPLAARIVAVADVFDALTHHRCYRRAWPVRRVLDEMMAQRDRQFDGRVVDALLRAVLSTDSVVCDVASDTTTRTDAAAPLIGTERAA